jgi:hypothetical protein
VSGNRKPWCRCNHITINACKSHVLNKQRDLPLFSSSILTNQPTNLPAYHAIYSPAHPSTLHIPYRHSSALTVQYIDLSEQKPSGSTSHMSFLDPKKYPTKHKEKGWKQISHQGNC